MLKQKTAIFFLSLWQIANRLLDAVVPIAVMEVLGADEVPSGQECGRSFENYQDIKPGDLIECFNVEVVQRSL